MAIKSFGQRRRPRGALLASVLLAHCAAVGRAGTPNSWSTVALSGDVPGGLYGHGTAEAGGPADNNARTSPAGRPRPR